MSPIVLMYHGIVSNAYPPPAEREAGAHLYDVSKESFFEQINYLANNDFKVSSLDEVVSGVKPNIVITFDDGEANNFHNAFPILRQFGFCAYFFVVVQRIGKRGYMNWEELKELRDANMLIGSHGLTHKILTELKDKEIEKELLESKLVLETNLKINIDYFSVPRGFYNKKIIDIAKNAGYQKVFVSDVQPDSSDMCIGRVAVKEDWSLGRFKQALEGKTPALESVSNSFKDSVKNALGTKKYNWIRNIFLKTPKNQKSSSKKGKI